MAHGQKNRHRGRVDAGRRNHSGRALICGNAGIVGMGLMGSSIAACLLAAGHTVAAVDVDPVKRRKAARQVLSLLEGLRRERLLKADPAKILQRLTVSDNYSVLQHSEIVVECVTEDLNVKRDVIRKVEQVLSPDTIIGSNTSAIPPTQLQQGALHPKRILGTHWAEPAHLTRFMEIICGMDTLPVYAERALALTRQLGKEPSLLRKDVRGFITNRVMYAMLREAFHLVESGAASIADVDRSLRNDLGYWITFAWPFRFMDLTGIPAYREVMRDLLPDLDCSQQVPALMERMVESGARGVANAKGFYNYTPSQAKRWQRRFLEFSYDVRALARKYPEEDASFASGTLARVDKQREDQAALIFIMVRCWTGAMLNGLRLNEPFLWVTIFVLTAIGVCATMTPSSPPPQGERTRSSEALAESLEKAISEAKTTKAHDLLLQVLKHPHLTSDLILRVGIQFAQHELYDDAAEAFQRCIQEHPEVFEAYYNLALADIAQQKWEAALVILQQAPKQSKAEVLACSYLRGKVEESQGKTSEAEHDLSDAFAGAPQNSAYAMDLGLFCVHERAYIQAATVFERALSFNSGSPFLLLGLSISRFLAGQHEQSVVVLRKLLSRQPDFAPGQLLLAYALSVKGKLEDAETVAHRGLSFPHPSPYLYYLDASVLVKLQSRHYKRIFEELSIAEREMPACSLCYLTQSKAHQAQGNVEAAIADLETVTRLDSTFPEAWYRLAALYRRVGRNEDASRAQDWFQSLEVDREGREVQMLRENFLQTMGAAQAAQ